MTTEYKWHIAVGGVREADRNDNRVCCDTRSRDTARVIESVMVI